EFGVAGDAQILAFIVQKLLIDQVSQHVFILFSDNLVGVSMILLLRFLAQLLLAALELRARDDLVVDAGDNLLDDRVCRSGQDREAQKKEAGDEFSHWFRVKIPKG